VVCFLILKKSGAGRIPYSLGKSSRYHFWESDPERYGSPEERQRKEIFEEMNLK